MISDTLELRTRIGIALTEMNLAPVDVLFPDRPEQMGSMLILFEKIGYQDLQSVSDVLELEQILLAMQDEEDAFEEARILAGLSREDDEVG